MDAVGTETRTDEAVAAEAAVDNSSKKGIAKFTEADVTALMGLVPKDWKNSTKIGVINPHVKSVVVDGKDVFEGSKKECEDYIESNGGKIRDHKRDLFGKEFKQTVEELATALTTDERTITADMVPNIIKSAENKARHLGGEAMKAAGKDPSAYRMWPKKSAGGGRGNGSFDESVKISAAELF